MSEHSIDIWEGWGNEQDILEGCIFRVNEGLCKTTHSAYTPSFISIGPYHHCNPALLKEQLKSKYLRSLLKRTNDEVSRESLLEKLKWLEPIATHCYCDPTGMSNKDEFVEMLLLDGCFVVEFVIRSTKFKLNEKDEFPHHYSPMLDDWTETQVVRDMLLMENQLPFFLLNDIYQMVANCTYFRGEESFLNLVKVAFRNMLPKLRYFSLFHTEFNEAKLKHILRVVHIIFCPRINEGGNSIVLSNESKPHPSIENLYSYIRSANELLHSSKESSQERESKPSIESCYIRSASELLDAGVRFKKVGDIHDSSFNNTNLFNIKFNRGVLEIPSFRLGASTETIFRNLIFYEQRSINISQNTLCSWTILSIPRKM